MTRLTDESRWELCSLWVARHCLCARKPELIAGSLTDLLKTLGVPLEDVEQLVNLGDDWMKFERNDERESKGGEG